MKKATTREHMKNTLRVLSAARACRHEKTHAIEEQLTCVLSEEWLTRQWSHAFINEVPVSGTHACESRVGTSAHEKKDVMKFMAPTTPQRPRQFHAMKMTIEVNSEYSTVAVDQTTERCRECRPLVKLMTEISH